MFRRISVFAGIIFQIGASCANAQDTTIEVPLLVVNSQVKTVTKGTQVSAAMDRTNAKDAQIIDVLCTDAGVTVTLTDPNGAVITSQNAASTGYDWQSITITGSTPDAITNLDPGIHQLISIPAGSPAGIYQIALDGTNASSDSIGRVTSQSDSDIGFALAADKTEYNLGDPVTLSALFFNGATPISNATVTADVLADSETSDVAASAFTLLASQGSDANGYQKTFRVSATNSGPAKKIVSAQIDLRKLVKTASVYGSQLTFPDLQANATADGIDELQLSCVQEQDCDPSSLSLIFHSIAPVQQQLRFADDGLSPDSAANDGIYTGSFTPPAPGEYHVLARVTADPGLGFPVNKIAATTFVVRPSTSIQNVAYQIMYSPDQSQVTGVAITGSVSVSQAGDYEWCTIVGSGADQEVKGCSEMSLQPGSTVMAANITSQQLLELGGAGTYSILKAQLWEHGPIATDVIANLDNPLVITDINLANLYKGPLYFTGDNSAQAIPASDGTYQMLQIQVGVSSQGGHCSWTGGIADSSGNIVGSASGSGTLNPNRDHFSLNFDGAALNSANISGPVTVRNVQVFCGNDSALSDNLFQTQPFTSDQFSRKASLTFSSSSVIVLPGSSGTNSIQYATSLNSSLHVIGLPQGITASFGGPNVVSGKGNTTLSISVDQSVPVGTYPVTVTLMNDSGFIDTSFNVIVGTGSAQPVSVSVTPMGASLGTNQTQQFIATVSNIRTLPLPGV